MADYFCVFMVLFPLPVSNMPCNRSRRRQQAYVLSGELPTGYEIRKLSKE